MQCREGQPLRRILVGDCFKPGDLVCLKCGGPTMIVESYDELGIFVVCSWYDRARYNSNRFREEALQLVPKKPPAPTTPIVKRGQEITLRPPPKQPPEQG